MFLCQRPLLLAQSSATLHGAMLALWSRYDDRKIFLGALAYYVSNPQLCFWILLCFSEYLLVSSLSSIMDCLLTLGFLLQGLSHYRESSNSHLKGLQAFLLFIIQNFFNHNVYYKQCKTRRYTSVDSWNPIP